MTQPQAQTAGAGAEGGQAAPPEGGSGGGGRTIPKVSGDRVAQLGPLIALILACIFFTTQSSQFLQATNFSLIIQQVMVVGTLAIGQTLIILTAGIDLSCGTAMALGSIVMTKLAVDSGVWPLYRYDPRLVETGKPPLQIDSGAIKANVRDYLRNETRFAMVEKIDPTRFRNLSEAAVRNTSQRLALYQELAKIAFPTANGNGNGNGHEPAKN